MRGHYAKPNKPVTKEQTLYDPSYKVSKVVKIMETKSKKMGAKSVRTKEEKSECSGYRLSDLQDEKVLEICCTVMWINIPNTTKLYI